MLARLLFYSLLHIHSSTHPLFWPTCSLPPSPHQGGLVAVNGGASAVHRRNLAHLRWRNSSLTSVGELRRIRETHRRAYRRRFVQVSRRRLSLVVVAPRRLSPAQLHSSWPANMQNRRRPNTRKSRRATCAGDCAFGRVSGSMRRARGTGDCGAAYRPVAELFLNTRAKLQISSN